MTNQTTDDVVERCEHGIRQPWYCPDCGAANEPTIASLYAELSAERLRAEQAEQKLAEAKEQFDLHVVWASDCSAAVERQIEALGEALYRLSGPLRSSGFIENSDNHQLYEAVVAAFREIGWKPDPLDEAIRSAASGEVE